MPVASVLPGAEAFSHDAAAGARSARGVPGGPQAPVTAVLLCHGFTGSPQSVRPWAQDLAGAGLTVSVPRLPGHGTHWRDLAGTGWADWLAAVDAELSRLRARGERVVVGGLSMGGALALRLAADRPGDVAGLMLVNPAVALTDPRVRAVPVLRYLRPSVRGVGGDVREGTAELAYDRVPLHALHSSLRGYAALRRDLHRVTAPLVVLRSAVDHVVPAASSAAVLAGVSSTHVRERVLERSWHVATLDADAPVVTAETLDLLARLDGAAAGPAAAGTVGTGGAAR